MPATCHLHGAALPVVKSGQLCNCVFFRSYLLALLESTDGNAVPGFLVEHVADTFAFCSDAVGRNTILADKHLLHRFGTVGCKLDVEVVVTVLRSIALHHNLCIGMALHIVGNHLYVGALVGGDYRRSDAEEYEANRIILVRHFLNYLGSLVAALLQFIAQGIGLCLPFIGGGCRLVELTAETVDLVVEGVDFGLVIRLYALETVAESIRYAGQKVEHGIVHIELKVAAAITATHVPGNRWLECQGHMVTDIEIEVEAGLHTKIIDVGAIGFVHIVMTPACADESVDREGTLVALVATE